MLPPAGGACSWRRRRRGGAVAGTFRAPRCGQAGARVVPARGSGSGGRRTDGSLSAQRTACNSRALRNRVRPRRASASPAKRGARRLRRFDPNHVISGRYRPFIRGTENSARCSSGRTSNVRRAHPPAAAPQPLGGRSIACPSPPPQLPSADHPPPGRHGRRTPPRRSPTGAGRPGRSPLREHREHERHRGRHEVEAVEQRDRRDLVGHLGEHAIALRG